MASSYERGRRFEERALRFLTGKGWRLLDRNVRFRRKELDLVVRRGSTVAFVEVKGRLGSDYGHPFEAITPRKRREVAVVARWWVARHGREGDEYRFDAVAVLHAPDGTIRVEHVEDAWRVEPF